MKKTIKGYIGSWNILCIDICAKSTKSLNFSNFKAVLDTGAYPCMVNKKLVNELQLECLKFETYNTVLDGQIKVPSFSLDISLDNIIFNNIEFSLFPSENPQFDILLGMSFLKDFDITYQGKQNIFEVSFDFD